MVVSAPRKAAAWIYLSDDQNYNTIPQKWQVIDFKLVDTLFIGPLGVQPDGTFGVFNSAATGPLAHRLEWVIKTARHQNHHIKIIVSQWYGSSSIWGDDLTVLKDTQAIQKYADSVPKFLKAWLPIAGGIDGFDIDYETPNVSDKCPQILAAVRSGLDALSKEHDGRPFYVTVSPDTLDFLKESVPSINFVNMQLYGYGYDMTPEEFINIGFKADQLLYGICAEAGQNTHTVQDAERAVEKYQLGGAFVWRLNSDPQHHELETQKKIHNFLHSDSK
jgi:hypothetical protein